MGQAPVVLGWRGGITVGSVAFMSSTGSSLSGPRDASSNLSDGGGAADGAKRNIAGWSAKLTQSLALKAGDTLVTLADARVVMTIYSEIGIEGASVALETLLKAAETRTCRDRKEATNRVAIALKARAVCFSSTRRAVTADSPSAMSARRSIPTAGSTRRP
jgi:hypothetical protein